MDILKKDVNILGKDVDILIRCGNTSIQVDFDDVDILYKRC